MIKKEFLSIFKSALKFKARDPSDWLRDSGLGLVTSASYGFTCAEGKTAQITQTWHKSSTFSVFRIIDFYCCSRMDRLNRRGSVLWMGQNKEPTWLPRTQGLHLPGSLWMQEKCSYVITKRGKETGEILKRAESQWRPWECCCMVAGVRHSPGHGKNIYIMGTTVPIVQIVRAFLLRGLISTGSNVSSSELLRATISITKICVSFLKMFFL